MDPYTIAKAIVERHLRDTYPGPDGKAAYVAALNRDLDTLIRRGQDNGIVGLAMFLRVLKEKGADVEPVANKIRAYLDAMTSAPPAAGRRKRKTRRRHK